MLVAKFRRISSTSFANKALPVQFLLMAALV